MAHRFYHADRAGLLKPGMTISFNAQGFSRFGQSYYQAHAQKKFEAMSDAEQREYLLESIRREDKFAGYESRLKCIFGSNSIAEAEAFANEIVPRPSHDIPIYEVFASRFWNLDTNWLDYKCEHEQRVKYLREYWYGAISNHSPAEGPRRPPKLEVLIALPATVGNRVASVQAP